MKTENKTILITGGASGIGKIMGQILLSANNRIILWDINHEALNRTLSEFSQPDRTEGKCIDLSDSDQIIHAVNELRERNLRIDILINNAGIVIGKYFQDNTTNDITRTFHINTIAPMVLAREILIDMLSVNSGHICNIASSAGMVANPKMAIYAASKWAVVGWSDSLRLEMKQQNKPVRVTTVMPYYINTGMFDGVKSRIPILDPEKVALQIIRAIERNKSILTLPGYLYSLTRLAQGIFPVRLYDFLADRILGIYHTMDKFKGHKNSINN